MPRTYSIVNRLTAWYVASLFVIVLIATCYLYWSLSKTLLSERISNIRERMHTVELLLRSQDGLSQAHQRIEEEWPKRLSERVFVRVDSVAGGTLVRTPDMPSLVTLELFSKSPLSVVRIRASSGDEFLSLFSSIPSPVGTMNVHIALDISKEAALLARYRNRLALVLTLALAISGLVGRRLAQVGFLPVHSISDAARRIRSTTLHERIEAGNLPIETSTLAETFNEMLDRLSDSFSRLSRFSSDIAHELRTPINNIHGEIDLALAKDRSPEEYRKVLESTLEESVRIQKIIDSLLFLAKTEDPETQINREKIDLKQELENIVDFFKASAEESGITITLSTSEGLRPQMERTLFQRAIVNLLANAADHTPEGGKIEVRAFTKGQELQISIQDNGKGIPEEDLPHIFDRFYRADPSRAATKRGGFGLGLSIVQGIAKLHRGSIRIESKVGVGTTAILLFPLELDAVGS